MPRLIGLFDAFDNLDTISAESIASWLKPTPDLSQIENYLTNKILYPQTLPQTEYEMQMDLGILREALKMNAPKSGNNLLGNNPFINTTLRKIIIPASFMNFVPSLKILAWIFIDAFLAARQKKDFFTDLWTIVLTDDTDETVGSLILPEFDEASGMMNLTVLGREYEIRPGSLTIIPCLHERCEIIYKLRSGRILGKSENAVEVSGGKLGLLVDGRKR